MLEFVESESYLGDMEITFKGSEERFKTISNKDYLQAVQTLLLAIENEIKSNVVEFVGSDFTYDYLHNIFGDKVITFPKDSAREEGQETFLADKDWYAYNANYGTSEERAFIELFARRYEVFTQQYEDIYVIRNEKVVKIFNKEGQAFEPDFLLFLRRKDDRHIVYQIFIEPKGAHLENKDKWKEEFLKEIRQKNVILDIDTDHYHITGVPFYNQGDENEFKKELETMLDVTG